MRQSGSSFKDDERAIEGLPIRLIIALVVGVAALALMMQVLDMFGGFGDEELTVEIENDVVDLGDAGEDVGNMSITVMTEDGEEIEGTTILLEPGTAQGDIVQYEMDDNQHTAEIPIGDFLDDGDGDFAAGVELATGQNRGTYEVDIIPPGDGDFTDDQDNPEITILDN